jgi:hypothetical protein
MTEEGLAMKRAEKAYKLFLNESVTAKLMDLGIFKALMMALSDSDVDDLIKSLVFFNPILSPASASYVPQSLPVGAAIDVNTIADFEVLEGVAIVLHEIGHTLNGTIKGLQGEFVADGYAVSHGFGEQILSTLAKQVARFPKLYDNKSTDTRIENVKKLLS